MSFYDQFERIPGTAQQRNDREAIVEQRLKQEKAAGVPTDILHVHGHNSELHETFAIPHEESRDFLIFVDQTELDYELVHEAEFNQWVADIGIWLRITRCYSPEQYAFYTRNPSIVHHLTYVPREHWRPATTHTRTPSADTFRREQDGEEQKEMKFTKFQSEGTPAPTSIVQ